MIQATATQQPVKVRIGAWINRGWDWFVRDLGISLLIGLVAAVLLGVLAILVGPIAAGLALAGIRKAERGKADFNDFFSGFGNFFLPALFSSILIAVFSIIGLIFLIIPGLVILSMYMFTFHYMVHRGSDFWQAMEASRKLVSRDYFGFVAFGLLLGLINVLGVMLMGVGVVITLPVTSYALTAAYLDSAGGIAPPPTAAPVKID
ncbi:MAG TPA: hypothetical protein PLP42_01945 [Acidobacteriota bacterium]|jgi:uncharacterized membrane protein|nr:hypothetical protein [Acidobacteriota bacterium]